ncbi:hypothetical protein QQF64_008321 [Cirrhinus molitorella]|uniref:Uncharacterized protein n=2 Tax=Cirrhinus molitorella TaxID=172907 RepID=A0ABR3M5U2_9TELE|nr:hypothetical protein Q8A67_018640 [Cirrhinus molitorella]
MDSSTIGIAAAFGILGLFLLICLLQICIKKIKCCKRKKPSVKDKILKKVGIKKSSPPFSISRIVDKK